MGGGRRGYNVVLEAVSIHLPVGVGTRSDLFGHLGDERVKLVDAQDWATIDEFRNLRRAHGSADDNEAAEFFDFAANRA
ncbi:hypothetical protein QBC47DRAFT_407348 [Echria macrotheca]|uniref:Uncharacterized protein n=1 Tax=Echria macrotheca TaxID=438768 RepID=A0AAJ0F6F0_9PEZI|nr:hypothetical protein QBC47DRAFT_407348 [Echria macrotheca]